MSSGATGDFCRRTQLDGVNWSYIKRYWVFGLCYIKSRKARWTGYVVRIGEMVSAYKILVVNHERKRSLEGRERRRRRRRRRRLTRNCVFIMNTNRLMLFNEIGFLFNLGNQSNSINILSLSAGS
jgi:hypothetical protein